MKALFSSIIAAKNGSPVPLFYNGKSMHSRYDPEKEAEQAALHVNESKFFIVAGAGGGYFIRTLKKRFPGSIILAAENSQDDIDFLKRIPVFRDLLSDKRVRIFPVEKTCDAMLRFYVPAFYGSFSIIETPSWANENKVGIEVFRTETASAARAIAADYSAQTHFGKIWQRNIIVNLAQIGTQSARTDNTPTDAQSRTEDDEYTEAGDAQNDASFAAPFDKTALIAAAGPSLDKALTRIENHRNDFYIIATDTAYRSFSKRGIRCDAVVSIDGQILSAEHFFSETERYRTLFVFDLCAHPSAVRFIKKAGGKIAFVQTGHPLARYASQFSEHTRGAPFPHIATGAGTVTIAALDFVLKAGFSDIAVCGADFSYSEKPYMKGTYLDSLYNAESGRTRSAETAFDALMFRTELFQNEDCRTTEVLGAYRKTFESLLSENCERIDYDGAFYRAAAKKTPSPLRFCTSFDTSSFASFFKTDFLQSAKELSYPDFAPAVASLFPAVASLRKQKNENAFEVFPELLKLAYVEILRYTQYYET